MLVCKNGVIVIDLLQIAKDTIRTQREELLRFEQRIDDSFTNICKAIYNCKGKIIITGVGKSGHIGKKIAASLSSTGTPCFFVHAAEAFHGDLGMIEKNDVVLAISYSGSTNEVLSIVPNIKKIGAALYAITGKPNSVLAQESMAFINVNVRKESCLLGLAPSSSTTLTLVAGDIIMSILQKMRNFKKEQFALFHPGGALGRRLLTKISDIMICGDKIPIVNIETPLTEIIYIISDKKLGFTCVVEDNKMLGIITDGDIRRLLSNRVTIISDVKARDIMTENYIYANKNISLLKALEIMENGERKITNLPILEDKKIVGIINLHDLIDLGVF